MQEILDRLDRIETLLSQGQREYLDNDAAASFLGLQSNTLEVWRTKREGPPFVRVGRKVMYAVADLREWMEARRQKPLA
ncbi:MAG: helix-turn-helix domain-containing protein [Rhodobacteraceae bacterium]|nr:helix-turn-helix domain-containing protein [Paracoccaceae bacterium]